MNKSSVGYLLPKIAKALEKPGISREVAFGNAPFIYYVCEHDPILITREARDGTKTHGVYSNGEFLQVG